MSSAREDNTHSTNTTVLAHSTTNTLEHHPAKPWNRTEAQDPSQEEKGKQPAATPGGEEQAVIQEEKDKHQELNQEEKGKPEASHNSPASSSS
jgi:hypothetical protein